MKHVVGGTLLVAGTSIGAGMLALPVVTAEGGFLPAFFIYLLCWMFMTCTGLLLLELCLKLPPDANLVSMGETYLGKPGKWAAWGLYLFLFYSLSIAYVSGGGGLVQIYLGGPIWISQIAFAGVLGFVVYLGALVVDRINSVFMIGLISAYLAFVFFGLSHVNLERIGPANWSASWFALPVVFTSFSYQGVIPSLVSYMKRDARLLRIAIVGGTSISFLIYFIWELLIFGIVPQEGLMEAARLGQTAVAPLSTCAAGDFVIRVGQAFAFFAITTSYLGVTLGLLDFLADGLKVAKKGLRKVGLALLTFVPPLAISLSRPDLFLVALSFAGGIGCACLLGLMPVLMVWASRYFHEGHDGRELLSGGRTMLLFLLFFVLFELSIEVALHI